MICLLANGTALAQKYNIQQYTANTGLPTNNIFDIVFDEKGNVWLASYDGVIKYDGYNYDVYDENSGLKDPVLYDLLLDNQHNLWASTEDGGIAKFSNGSFHYPEELSWLDTTIVHFMMQANDGNIWLSVDQQGVYIIDEDLKVVDHISLEDGLPSERMSHFYSTNTNQVLISSHAGLAVYNELTKEIEKTYTNNNGLGGIRVYESLVDRNGRIWVAHDKGASVIQKDGSIINYEVLAGARIGLALTIRESNDGKIWVGSNKGGVFWIDGAEETHITIKHGLSSNNIYRFVESKSGNIWIATDGNGISVFKDKNFRIYDDVSVLDAKRATSLIEQEDGTVWITTEYGISSLKNDVIKNYRADPELLAGELILASTLLPNGNIIMVTNNYSLLEFDGKNFFKSKYTELLNGLIFNSVAVDGNTIWFVGDSNLIKVEGENVEYVLTHKGRAWKTDYQYLLKDSRGLTWIATLGGIAVLNGEEFIFIDKEDGLSSEWITIIKEDPYGNIWAVTSVGIDIISGIEENGSFKTIKPFKTVELYFDKANFLQFDHNGNLWQGTNSGLNYYQFEEPNSFDNYEHFHFPLNSFGYGTEFAFRASLLAKDSTLYFGTYNSGLITLNFDNIEDEIEYEPAPEMHIQSILANGQEVYNQETPQSTDEILTLSFSQNRVTINLSSLSEKFPGRINYRYKLLGLQDDWEVVENINQIQYEILPPGTYNLVVQTKAPNSDWSAEQDVVSFRIKKPFFLTVWFIVLIVLLICVLVYVIVKARVSIIEKDLLQSKVDDQTKDIQHALDEKEVLIKEIHHRVKNNLAVISGLLDLQSRQIDEGPATEALQNSMTRVLAMAKIHEQLYQNEDLANVNFKNFITNLVRSLDNTISNADFPTQINEHVEDISVDVNVGVPLGLMINEILSNSFKHAFQNLELSKSASIDIEFSCKDDQSYHLRIADNGVGSKENLLEMEHQSLGMTLIKSWASQLDAELTYDGTNGSVFEAKIPV
ncbi:MAG: hypothetical protein JJ895_16445 [Balneolaceae bacterium]|nr:hypothetical protein [Balneolaceae bacterium]